MIERFLSILGGLSIYVFCGLAAGFGTYSLVSKNLIKPCEPDSQTEVAFEIREGTDLTQIAEELQQKKLIRTKLSVRLLQMFNDKYKNKELTIKTGEYPLSPSMTPSEILDRLLNGEVITREIIIPPGIQVGEVPGLIAASGLVSETQVDLALNTTLLLRKLGISAHSFEGYIFPGKHVFSKPITAEEIITRIVRLGMKRMGEFAPGWEEKAAQLGFSTYQLLTLASLVEKETDQFLEKPLIASVFLNRMRIGMPLNSDAALAYSIPNFHGSLTEEHRATPGPYNTFLTTGLPQGPICTPSVDSINAVLSPADTDNLYFAAIGDGTHRFSPTYKEHLEIVESIVRAQLNE